jgi:DNA-binding CsgD family transcriptional regulator
MTIPFPAPIISHWASRPVASSSRRIGLADGLNDEWRRLCADPTALACVNGWRLPLGPVEHLDQLLWQAGYGRPVDDEPGDRLLALIVHRAARDELAARIVLHRILPGLIRIALRRGRIVEGGAAAAFAELAAAAWLTIRTFPIDRRGHCVAANILRDVGVGDMEAAVGEVPDSEVDLDPGAHHEWGELVAWARRRGVDARQLDLLVRMARGQSNVDIAKALGCTDRTIRNRRDAALAAVRRAYAGAAA